MGKTGPTHSAKHGRSSSSSKAEIRSVGMVSSWWS